MNDVSSNFEDNEWLGVKSWADSKSSDEDNKETNPYIILIIVVIIVIILIVAYFAYSGDDTDEANNSDLRPGSEIGLPNL